MTRHSEAKKAGLVTVGQELLRLARYMEAREDNTHAIQYTGWRAGKALRRFERKYRPALKTRVR